MNPSPPASPLVPVIRGLVSEADRVRSLLTAGGVDSVALSVSPEELKALSAPPEEAWSPASLEERIYADALGRFGPVRMPPPCFVAAVEVSREQGLKTLALDLEESAFTDLFLGEVGTWDLVRHSFRLRRLARRRWEARTPVELVMALDASFAYPPSYRRVEEARERRIAASLDALCREGNRPLALVEAERFEGVLRRFREGLPADAPAPP